MKNAPADYDFEISPSLTAIALRQVERGDVSDEQLRVIAVSALKTLVKTQAEMAKLRPKMKMAELFNKQFAAVFDQEPGS